MVISKVSLIFRRATEHTYIYICSVYIYCHPNADCFVVSHLFSVTRHIGRLKLGSKPTQFYVRRSTIPISQQANHLYSGIRRHYLVAFVYTLKIKLLIWGQIYNKYSHSRLSCRYISLKIKDQDLVFSFLFSFSYWRTRCHNCCWQFKNCSMSSFYMFPDHLLYCQFKARLWEMGGIVTLPRLHMTYL